MAGVYVPPGKQRVVDPVTGDALENGLGFMYILGTDTAKDLLYGRLQVSQPGPGYVHFARELMAEFYDQLTAESRMLVKTGRGEEHRWLKPAGKRNEKLDCTVYALFCAQMLGLPDLFAAQQAAVPTDIPAVQASAQGAASASGPPAMPPPRPSITPPFAHSSPIASSAWSSRL